METLPIADIIDGLQTFRVNIPEVQSVHVALNSYGDLIIHWEQQDKKFLYIPAKRRFLANDWIFINVDYPDIKILMARCLETSCASTWAKFNKSNDDKTGTYSTRTRRNAI